MSWCVLCLGALNCRVFSSALRANKLAAAIDPGMPKCLPTMALDRIYFSLSLLYHHVLATHAIQLEDLFICAVCRRLELHLKKIHWCTSVAMLHRPYE